MKCHHEDTSNHDYTTFMCPVALEPYTSENPAAWGGIACTETCDDCGAHRLVAINGRHKEFGPWSGGADDPVERAIRWMT